MKVLIIDNYDSFTYNLYQYIGEILDRKAKIEVKRNDEITISQIKKEKYYRIIISPGPGSPDDPAYFGVCAKVLTEIGKSIPVLGVCLGMQGMAHYFGGKVTKAKSPMHGKTSEINHNNEGVFNGLPKKLEVMRYHSLIADKKTIPKCLKITAETMDKEKDIMGLTHVKFPIQGVQFHPESFATEGGKLLLSNFLC
ncbi:MAG: anthranilate/aminodeoxychorismate synthase component II [Candidatus Moranbacteria bacterium]|nr:anthranilate/aminodeoxychorismate synthase component II [Candidatus Moranbacteria bacterium]